MKHLALALVELGMLGASLYLLTVHQSLAGGILLAFAVVYALIIVALPSDAAIRDGRTAEGSPTGRR